MGFCRFRQIATKHGPNLWQFTAATRSSRLQPAVCATVESAAFNEDNVEKQRSDIFVPITKDVSETLDQFGFNLKFCLANVEAFVRPVAVIPDIGGPANAHFELKERSKWKLDFAQWLREPHNLDQMLDSDNKCNSESDEELANEDTVPEEIDSGSDDEQGNATCYLDNLREKQ